MSKMLSKRRAALFAGCAIAIGPLLFSAPAMAGCNSGDAANTDLLNSRFCEAAAAGGNATALGTNSTASGVFSSAYGNFSTASGDVSSAYGNVSTASGFSSSAYGTGSTLPPIADIRRRIHAYI
jgi:hypothetical protein